MQSVCRLVAALICSLLLLASCAGIHTHKELGPLAYGAAADNSLLRRFLPLFLVDKPEDDFNRIGTPTVRLGPEDREEVVVDPGKATIFAEVRSFQGARGRYTNLIYRLHFAGTPFTLLPFSLGYGDNIGLLVIVTLDPAGKPILYSSTQTCGCYLTFVPTSYMPKEDYPPLWPADHQMVYGESIVSRLDYDTYPVGQGRTVVEIGARAHRFHKIWRAGLQEENAYRQQRVYLRPLSDLRRLPVPQGGLSSFFAESGPHRGYVRGSSKPMERLLMSWWAWDWQIGVDKRLGRNRGDGLPFYTSIKPWQRQTSDMRDFGAFLEFWGWLGGGPAP